MHNYAENPGSTRIIGRGDQHVRVEMRGMYGSGESYFFLRFNVPCKEPYGTTLNELAHTDGFREAAKTALRHTRPLSRTGYEEVVAHHDGARANYVVDTLEGYLRKLDAQHRAAEDGQRTQRGIELARREDPTLYKALWGSKDAKAAAGFSGTIEMLLKAEAEIRRLREEKANLAETRHNLQEEIERRCVNILEGIERLRERYGI